MQKNAHRMEKNMGAPDIEVSSENERREYIKNKFKCIADCDMCGLCTVFKGKEL